jgi:nicotinamide riboside transporter PnuC
MLKNIITVLAILSFFAIVYFGWEHYRSLNNQAEDIYYIIPKNAALVFDFQSIGRGKKNISETEVWKELSVTGWAGEINRNIAFLDSLFSNNEETKQLTGTLRVVVSAPNRWK